MLVHSASVQGRDGGWMLMEKLMTAFPLLQKLFIDAAYQGAIFREGLVALRKAIAIEIVKRSDQAEEFVVLPKRWIVERTLTWLNRCGRLAKDRECLSGLPASCFHSSHD